MTLNNYYLHAIESNGNVIPLDINASLNKLKEILSTGYILSRRKMGYNSSNLGWNGLDYISLCDYEKTANNPYKDNELLKNYNSFDHYIKCSLSLMFPKQSIKVEETKLLPPITLNHTSLEDMPILGNSKKRRYSDYPDEVQAKNSINLNKMSGLLLPISNMINSDLNYVYSEKEILDFINEINILLEMYKRKTPIYDLDTLEELKSEDNLNKVLIKLKDIN